MHPYCPSLIDYCPIIENVDIRAYLQCSASINQTKQTSNIFHFLTEYWSMMKVNLKHFPHSLVNDELHKNLTLYKWHTV